MERLRKIGVKRIDSQRPYKKMKKRKSCMVRFRDTRGVISIFLCGVLLLMSVSSAAFMDYARFTLAQAESRATLKMLSHATLAGFDKTMAREFGLFAVEDTHSMQEKAEELLAQRFPEDTASLGVHVEQKQITVMPSDNARLSRPEVLMTQIQQFMEWQIPSAALGKVLEHIGMMKQLSESLPAWQSKIQYEKELHTVQQAINACFSQNDTVYNACPPGMRSLALPASVESSASANKDKIFAGVPSPAPVEQALSDGVDWLDEDLLNRLQKAANEQNKVPSDAKEWTALLSAKDKEALKSTFLIWREKYSSVSSWLDRLVKTENQTLSGLKNTEEKMRSLAASRASWREEVSRLPLGAVSQSLLGDYLSATSALDAEKLHQLSVEWENMSEKTKTLSQAWEDLRLDQTLLEDLTFEKWLTSRIASIKRLSANSFSLPKMKLSTLHPLEWEKGIPLSEDSIHTQSILAAQSNDDRSGFFEFIKAWNVKRKAIANARKAKRMGMPELAGGITDYLMPDVLQRYEADTHSFSDEDWKPPEGNEMEMLNGLFHEVSRIAEAFTGLSSTDAGEIVSLLTYWTNMFSDRTAPLMEKEQGVPLLSLNGFPLKERKVFGGELEYILYGRPLWVENIRRAEHHILAIRLLCNMLYAFTSSELNAETAQVALALAGWTGFAVPLVQSALLAVLAVGETALDMDTLTAGERVVVMKTPDTWHFSLSGVAQLAKTASHDVFDALADNGIAAVEAGADTLQETMNRMKDSLLQKAEDAVHQPVLQLMEMCLLEADAVSDEQRQAKIAKILKELSSRGGEGKLGVAVSGAFSRLSQQSTELNEVIKDAREKKRKAGKATEAVLRQLRDKTEAIVNQACIGLSSFVDQGVDQLTNKLRVLVEEKETEGRDKVETALATFQVEMGGNDAAGSMTVGSGLTMRYSDYILLLLVISSTSRAGRDVMLSQTARLIQAETGETDLTIAPTSLDWRLEGRLSVAFLPQFSSSLLGNTLGKQVEVREDWQEGYGQIKDNSS